MPCNSFTSRSYTGRVMTMEMLMDSPGLLRRRANSAPDRIAHRSSHFLSVMISRLIRNRPVARRMRTWSPYTRVKTGWLNPGREQLFLTYHASLFSGHLGRNWTLARLAHRFYWSGMSDDVKEWLTQCVTCVKRKSPVGRYHPMGNILTGHRWDRIAMDILDVCDPTPIYILYIYIYIYI